MILSFFLGVLYTPMVYAGGILGTAETKSALRLGVGLASHQLCTDDDGCTYRRSGIAVNADASTIANDRYLADLSLNVYQSEGDIYGMDLATAETRRLLSSLMVSGGVILFPGCYIRAGVGLGRHFENILMTDGRPTREPVNDINGYAFMGDGGYSFFINDDLAVGVYGRYEMQVYDVGKATIYGGGTRLTFQPNGGKKNRSQ